MSEFQIWMLFAVITVDMWVICWNVRQNTKQNADRIIEEIRKIKDQDHK